MTLVAPLWADRDWFADLLLLLTHQPLALPLWDDVVHQPHNDLLHPGVPALKLHAWRLSSNSSESRGFSRGAASDMSRCVRESTSNVYQSKWLAFCNWCRGRGVAPVSASVPLIVDFFRHLVRNKGLSVPAVRGYRASLNSVFALKGRDLAASREVSMLFRSFSKTARPERLRPPNWDISLVLQSLTRAPYEPLRVSG